MPTFTIHNYHQEPTTQAAPTLALRDYFYFLLVANIVTWADINPLLYAKDAQIKFFKAETFDSLVELSIEHFPE